jgi:hypothetical protein
LPRYFFHLHDRFGSIADPDGLELPGLDAAISEAIRGARSIIAEDVQAGVIHLGGRIEIADETGEVLRVVRFHEVVSITGQDQAADAGTARTRG